MTSKYQGITGKFLEINLTTGEINDYKIPDLDYKLFLGGKALAAKILWDKLMPGVDPLGPHNIMVLSTGPLNGSSAPQSSRFNISTKSPLSLGITSSNSGGDFGTTLKKSGLDGIILKGKADIPTWIEIIDGKVTLRDAGHIWGKNTEETIDGIDKKTASLCIGPAGENMARFACIMAGTRAHGRGGVGAVMGSKKVKLITVKGSEKISYHDREGFKKSVKSWTKLLKNNSITGDKLPKYGTSVLMNRCNDTNTLGTHNFKYSTFKDADKVSGETLEKNHLTKNWGCTTCPVRCSREVKYKDGVIKGPEFETMGMFGPMIENTNLDAIIEWNYICDLVGMDTITAGSTIACAMELKELGLWDDFPASFGKTDHISGLLYDIAYKRNHGKLLAEGSMRLSKQFKRDDLAMHSKGLEYAIYEPRGAVGHGLGYATANRGGCHLNGGYLIFLEALGPLTIDPLTDHAKPGLTVMNQNLFEAISASGNCIFSSYIIFPDLPGFITKGPIKWIISEVTKLSRFFLNFLGRIRPWMIPINFYRIPHSKVLAQLTGMKMTLGNFLAVGERGFTLERLLNLREGLTSEDDSLAPRLTDTPAQPGNPKTCVPLKKMLPIYYKTRDWDHKGIPTKRLLKKLKMDFLL